MFHFDACRNDECEHFDVGGMSVWENCVLLGSLFSTGMVTYIMTHVRRRYFDTGENNLFFAFT